MATQPQTRKSSASVDDLGLNNYLLLIPLLGLAFAVSYEAGVFLGVGIWFFTFFSFMEHVVYALKLLPILVVSTIAIIAYANWQRSIAWNSLTSISIIAVALFFLVLSIWFHKLIAAAFLLVAIFAFMALWSKSVLRRLTLATLAIVIVTFISGYQVALNLTNRSPLAVTNRSPKILSRLQPLMEITPATIETDDGTEIEANLILSGKQGILFYDRANGQVTLLRSASVVRVTSVVSQKEAPPR